jgi:hypothetical protein
MQLTSREIELLRQIPPERARRRRNLFLGLACWLLLPTIAMYADINDSSFHGIDLADMYALLGGFLAGQWAWYLRTRPEDKLIDIIQRYVNRDAEAIRAIAKNPDAES